MNLYRTKFITSTNVSDDQIRDNVRRNMQRDLPRIRTKRAVFVGGGPSIAEHVEDIRLDQTAGAAVFALNGAHDWLIAHGIVPDYMVMLDARADNVAFVRNPQPSTVYLLCSNVHPDVFDALDGHRVVMWHVCSHAVAIEAFREVEPGATIHAGGTTVGLCAPQVAFTMGYRDFTFYGYDSSHSEAGHHAYPQALNDGCEVSEVVHRGKAFRADAMMAHQAQQFIQSQVPMWERLGVSVSVRGDGLLPFMFASRGKTGNQDVDERDKYQRMWQCDIYRKFAPGEAVIDTAIAHLAPHEGARFIDFGSGTGRPAKALQDKGFKVLAVDFVTNAMDEDIYVPFCLASLWDLPETVRGDYGLCTDVMEHIPTDRVDDVLANISRAVPACFFQIAHDADRMGALIGETLHLTVRPAEWWIGKLKGHFNEVRHIGDGQFLAHGPS